MEISSSRNNLKNYTSLNVNELRKICVDEKIVYNNNLMTMKGSYIKKKTLIELLISSNKFIKSEDKIPGTKEITKENCYSLGVKGQRDYMEDTFTVNTFEDITIYAVFDGHGGDEISKKLVNLYPKAIFSNLTRDVRYNINKVKNILKAIYIKLDEVLKKIPGESGSTAIVCITIANVLYMINLGDSRGIYYYYKNGIPTIIHSSSDHKPNNIIEKLWINKCNGTVELDEDDDDDETYRVDGYLALSRAFGDYDLKYSNIDNKVGPVSNIPDIKVYPIDFSKKSHMILASDGLWDVMDNETALRYIDTKNLKSSCKLLIRDSLKTSTDNITVLLANIN